MAYGSEYRRMVAMLVRKGQDRERALIDSVGGDFSDFGTLERTIVFDEGLSADGLLVDVGCGAGRLATALQDASALRYLGVDVVPDLIAYARGQVKRPDWTFTQIDGPRIPLKDGEADMAVYFSVFTHISERDILDHLREAQRFLRPGGKVVFSFLDPGVAVHKRMVKNPNRWLARLMGWARNVGAAPGRVREWASETGFSVTPLKARRCWDNPSPFCKSRSSANRPTPPGSRPKPRSRPIPRVKYAGPATRA